MWKGDSLNTQKESRLTGHTVFHKIFATSYFLAPLHSIRQFTTNFATKIIRIIVSHMWYFGTLSWRGAREEYRVFWHLELEGS